MPEEKTPVAQPKGVTLEEMEQTALGILKHRMCEGRWYPRRHTVGLVEPFMTATSDAIWSILAWLWRFPRGIWRLLAARSGTATDSQPDGR